MQTRSREGRSGNDRATVGRTTSPFGDSLREFVLHSLSKRGARPAYETFPAGTSSPAGRSVKETLELQQLGEHWACLRVNKGQDMPHFPRLSGGFSPQQLGLLLLAHCLGLVLGEQMRSTPGHNGFPREQAIEPHRQVHSQLLAHAYRSSGALHISSLNSAVPFHSDFEVSTPWTQCPSHRLPMQEAL